MLELLDFLIGQCPVGKLREVKGGITRQRGRYREVDGREKERERGRHTHTHTHKQRMREKVSE